MEEIETKKTVYNENKAKREMSSKDSEEKQDSDN